MDDGILSLRWNNHSSAFINFLSLLHQKETYCDVTLACDGQFFAVHKLVLSVCSEYFEDILKKTTCTKPVIVLKDIRCKDLQALLSYMYTGEASVPQSDLTRLMKAAECLHIKGLAVPDNSPPSKDKKRDADNVKIDDYTPKKRKSDLLNSIVAHSLSDVDRLGDSDMLDVREIRGTIVQHGTSQAIHTIDESSNSSSPQPTGVILHHPQQHGLQEHITLRHFSTTTAAAASNKHPVTMAPVNRNSSGSPASVQETIVTHTIPEVRVLMEEGAIKEELKEEASGGSSGRGASNAEGGQHRANNTSHPSTANSGASIMQDFLAIPASSQHQETLVTWDGGTATIAGYTLEGIIPEELRQSHTNSSAIHATVTTVDGGEGSTETGTPVSAMGCPYCPRAFMYRSDLNRHVRTHTGERPYTCSQCSYRASQKSHLLEHQKRRHRSSSSNNGGTSNNSIQVSSLVVPGTTLLVTANPMINTSSTSNGPSTSQQQHILHTPTASSITAIMSSAATPSSSLPNSSCVASSINASGNTSASAGAHTQLLYTITPSSTCSNGQPTAMLYSSSAVHTPHHHSVLHTSHSPITTSSASTGSNSTSVLTHHNVTTASQHQQNIAVSNNNNSTAGGTIVAVAAPLQHQNNNSSSNATVAILNSPILHTPNYNSAQQQPAHSST